MPIQTQLDARVAEAVVPKVQTSDVLGGPWTDEPYLYPNRLRRALAPEIDECELEYSYGTGYPLGPDGRDPYQELDRRRLNGKFVRIEFREFAAADLQTWVGVIEECREEVLGRRETDQPAGKQRFTAYGLLRLWDILEVRDAAVYAVPAAPPIRINRSLQVNVHPHGEITDRGNRSAIRFVGPYGDLSSYLFSGEPQGTADKWTAYDFVEYLLADQRPRNGSGNAITVMENRAVEQALNWFDVSFPTDGRTVKQLLDALIPRRRGVTYRIDIDPVTAHCYLATYTFNHVDLQVDNTHTIPRNPASDTLDFEEALDVEVQIRESYSAFAHRVYVRGERRTSTCTLGCDPILNQLVPDWTVADEAAYLAAASAEAGYGALTVDEQQARNARWRSHDLFAHVFQRFRLSDTWDQQVADGLTRVWVAPVLDPVTGDPQQPVGTTSSGYTEGESWWHRGARIERTTVLRERYDYEGNAIAAGTTAAAYAGLGLPEFLPPIVFIGENVGTADEIWRQVEQLCAENFEDEAERNWSCHAQCCDQGPVFEVRVAHAGCAHFLSKTDFLAGSPAAYSDQHDPDAQLGLDYHDLFVTLTLALDSRVESIAEIKAPGPAEALRNIHLDIEDARLDYVVPGTAVQIHDGTYLISDGGFVRDDRARLRRIAAMAAQWYAIERQTITLTVRRIFTFMKLGDLITDIGPTYQAPTANPPDAIRVNSLVTAIDWDFVGQRTTIQTSFEQMDFS